MNIINQLIEYGTVKRPYIGIGGRNLTESLAKQYDYPVGIYVQEVYEDTPAEEAGIEAGDVITEINGEEVETMDELNSKKNQCEIGDEITLKVYRDGNYKDFKLTLAETPETDDEEETSSSNSSLQDYYDNYDKNNSNSNSGSYFFNPFNY
jgi:serine protease Do